jgi:hypothetical protein
MALLKIIDSLECPSLLDASSLLDSNYILVVVVVEEREGVAES